MKVVSQNRKARFDYDIQETLEAGLILTGPEVKSCRAGHVSLAGSYVSFHGGKVVLKQAKIQRYPFTSETVPHDAERDKQLLLKASQAQRLQAAANEKGIAIVPLEMHAGKYIKVLIGIGKGRKRVDKRQRIKERETGRRIREGREI